MGMLRKLTELKRPISFWVFYGGRRMSSNICRGNQVIDLGPFGINLYGSLDKGDDKEEGEEDDDDDDDDEFEEL
ncbi:hypothetical protein Lal_00004576 [Lupinus albus]|nr:hypothetical protein Lal_00004576 [Lupinus albus]